jgi:hypothetical protein
MHDLERTANLLGATALAVNDAVLVDAARRAGVSGSGAAALVVLSGRARRAARAHRPEGVGGPRPIG